MMMAGCCCGACPACAGLPSTISVSISGTASDFCVGCESFTVAGTCILTKSCPSTGEQTYRGVACDLATFEKLSICTGIPECLAHKLFAAICLSCFESSGVVTWVLYVTTYAAAVSEDCSPCSCAQLTNTFVSGNSCILSASPYCYLSTVCTNSETGGSVTVDKTGTNPLGSYSIDGMTFVLT